MTYLIQMHMFKNKKDVEAAIQLAKEAGAECRGVSPVGGLVYHCNADLTQIGFILFI